MEEKDDEKKGGEEEEELEHKRRIDEYIGVLIDAGVSEEHTYVLRRIIGSALYGAGKKAEMAWKFLLEIEYEIIMGSGDSSPAKRSRGRKQIGNIGQANKVPDGNYRGSNVALAGRRKEISGKVTNLLSRT